MAPGPLWEFPDVAAPTVQLPHANDAETLHGHVADTALDALNAWRQEQPPG